MIGLDTNILIRLIARDDKKQHAAAEKLLNSAKEPFYVNLIVLCEVLWVLRSSYAFTKAQLLEAATMLANSAHFVVEKEMIVHEALEFATEYGADIPDALIALINQHDGCKHTLTFDAKAQKVRGFKRV